MTSTEVDALVSGILMGLVLGGVALIIVLSARAHLARKRAARKERNSEIQGIKDRLWAVEGEARRMVNYKLPGAMDTVRMETTQRLRPIIGRIERLEAGEAPDVDTLTPNLNRDDEGSLRGTLNVA